MLDEDQYQQPPGLLLQFFRWFCHPELSEHIEGDLHERWETYEGKSKTYKKLLFFKEILKLIKPGLVRPLVKTQKLTAMGMFKNDIKTSFRFLKRERLYTLINLLGLSSGLAIALLMIQYVRFEFSYEDYNPMAENIARITIDYMDGETVVDQDCETYPPLAPKMKDEFSEVVDYARTYHIDELNIQIEDRFIAESKMYAADPSFFSMFNYPFIHGDATTAFKAPYEAVLTVSQAKRLYGEEDVVGKTLRLSDVEAPFKVVGVIEDSPANTHLKFNMLISFETMKAAYGEKDDNWGGNNTFAYLLLHENTDFGKFQANLVAFNEELHSLELLEEERAIAQPMKDIHLFSHKSFEPETNGDYNSVMFLLGVAILVIIIALVNYINLSTSKALDRAKEVGIRKVLGSTKTQLRNQFLAESFLINITAGAIAVALMSIFLPQFKQIAQLHDNFQFLNDTFFWALLGGLLVANSLISGLLPALVLSSFKPITALKGKYTNSTSGVALRKGLVIVQFSITTFLLVQTLAANWQLDYMRDMDLGLDTDRVLVTATPKQNFTKEGMEAFKGEILSHSLFTTAGVSSCVPGMPSHQMGTTTGINPVSATEERNNNFYIYSIDEDFIETMEMEMEAGDNMGPGKLFDKVLVNEQALKVWGYASPEEALGEEIKLWGNTPRIAGIVKDFHQFSPKEPHIPIIFIYHPGSWSLFSVKATSGTPKEQMAALESVYERTFPNNPFDAFFLDTKFDNQFQQDAQFQQVFTVLTIFAIIISCLGLFGLASFTATKRAKEIGVRKVLGASVAQLIFLISRSFLGLVGISLIFALPVTYYVIDTWLDGFANAMDTSIWLFILPCITVVFVAAASVFLKTYKVSIANPVKALRDE